MECSVENCHHQKHGLGLCRSHLRRFRAHGDVGAETPLLVHRVGCSVEGCDGEHVGLGLCSKHYARLRRHGSVDIVERAANGTDQAISQGYRVVVRHGHPLANKWGRVRLQRLVLFETIGPGEHPCHWCGRVVTWDKRYAPSMGEWSDDALVVDHVNHDTLDNRPENLVPSCQPCNSHRDRRNESACRAEDCAERGLKKGLCEMHYMREYRAAKRVKAAELLRS